MLLNRNKFKRNPRNTYIIYMESFSSSDIINTQQVQWGVSAILTAGLGMVMQFNRAGGGGEKCVSFK